MREQTKVTIEGSTDSERLFRLFHARYLEGGRSFPVVVRDTLREVLQTYTSPVLNAMYLAPEALYVLNAHNPTSVPYAGDPPEQPHADVDSSGGEVSKGGTK